MKYLILSLLLLTSCAPRQHREPQKEIIHLAGTIRCYGFNNCALISDNDHHPLNVVSSEASGDYLVVDFPPNITGVVSFLVTPDETLSQYGITCGSSVGFNRAVIRCYGYKYGVWQPFRAIDLAIPNANIWFYGVMER